MPSDWLKSHPDCRSCQALQGRPIFTGRHSGSQPLHNRGQLQASAQRQEPPYALSARITSTWVCIDTTPEKLYLCLQVQNAISRAKKEATVEKLVHHLETSALCFGVRYKHVGVSSADPGVACSMHLLLSTWPSSGLSAAGRLHRVQITMSVASADSLMSVCPS